MAPKRYPPVPPSFRAPAGEVQVRVVSPADIKRYADPGEELFGVYSQEERVIYLRSTIHGASRWRTLYHELAHVWLDDSGLRNGLAHDLEEALVDAVSTGLMQMRFG